MLPGHRRRSGQEARPANGPGCAIFLGRIDLFALCFVFPGRDDRTVWIFDIVGQFTGFAVKPDIADHAVLGGEGSGGQGRMTDDGFGVGMLVMGIGEIGALRHK